MTKQSLTPRGTGPKLEVSAGASSLHGYADQLRQGKTVEDILGLGLICTCGDIHDKEFKCYATVNGFVSPFSGKKTNGSDYQMKKAKAAKVDIALLLKRESELEYAPSGPSKECGCRISANGLIDPIDCGTAHAFYPIPLINRWCDQTTSAMRDCCYLLFWSGWARPSVMKLLGRRPPYAAVLALMKRTDKSMLHDGQQFLVTSTKLQRDDGTYAVSIHVAQHRASRVKPHQVGNFHKWAEQSDEVIRIGGVNQGKPNGMSRSSWIKIRNTVVWIKNKVNTIRLQNLILKTKRKLIYLSHEATFLLDGLWYAKWVVSGVANLISELTTRIKKGATALRRDCGLFIVNGTNWVSVMTKRLIASVGVSMTAGGVALSMPVVRIALDQYQKDALMLAVGAAVILTNILLGVSPVNLNISIDKTAECGLNNRDALINLMINLIKQYASSWRWAVEPIINSIWDLIAVFKQLNKCYDLSSLLGKADKSRDNDNEKDSDERSEMSSGVTVSSSKQGNVSLFSTMQEEMDVAPTSGFWLLKFLFTAVKHMLCSIDNNRCKLVAKLTGKAFVGSVHGCGVGKKHGWICEIITFANKATFCENKAPASLKRKLSLQIVNTCPCTMIFLTHCSTHYVSWIIQQLAKDQQTGPSEITHGALGMDLNKLLKNHGGSNKPGMKQASTSVRIDQPASDNQNVMFSLSRSKSASNVDSRELEKLDSLIVKEHDRQLKKVRRVPSFESIVPAAEVGKQPFDVLKNLGWPAECGPVLRRFWREYSVQYIETTDKVKLVKMLACRKLENYYALWDVPTSADELKQQLREQDFDTSNKDEYLGARKYFIDMLPYSKTSINTPTTPTSVAEIFAKEASLWEEPGLDDPMLTDALGDSDSDDSSNGSNSTVVPSSSNMHSLHLFSMIERATRSTWSLLMLGCSHRKLVLLGLVLCSQPLVRLWALSTSYHLKMLATIIAQFGENFSERPAIYKYYQQSKLNCTPTVMGMSKAPASNLVNPLKVNSLPIDNISFNNVHSNLVGQPCAWKSELVWPGKQVVIESHGNSKVVTTMNYGRVNWFSQACYCSKVNETHAIRHLVTATHILSPSSFNNQVPDFAHLYINEEGNIELSHDSDSLPDESISNSTVKIDQDVFMTTPSMESFKVGRVLAVAESTQKSHSKTDDGRQEGTLSANGSRAIRYSICTNSPQGLSGSAVLNENGDLMGVCSYTSAGPTISSKLSFGLGLMRNTSIVAVMGNVVTADVSDWREGKSTTHGKDDIDIKCPVGMTIVLDDVGSPMIKQGSSIHAITTCATINASRVMENVSVVQSNKVKFGLSVIGPMLRSKLGSLAMNNEYIRLDRLIDLATLVPVEVTYLTRRELRSSIRVAENMGDDESWKRTGLDSLLSKVIDIKSRHKKRIDDMGAEGYLTMPGVFDTSARNSIAKLDSKGNLDVDEYDRLLSNKVFTACAYALEMIMSTMDFATWANTQLVIDASQLTLSIEELSIIVAFARVVPLAERVIVLSSSEVKKEHMVLTQLRAHIESSNSVDRMHLGAPSSPGAAAYNCWSARVWAITTGAQVCPNYEEAPWLHVACQVLPNLTKHDVYDSCKAVISVVYGQYYHSIRTMPPLGVTTNRTWKATTSRLAMKILKAVSYPIRKFSLGLHNFRHAFLNWMTDLIAEAVSKVEDRLADSKTWVTSMMFKKRDNSARDRGNEGPIHEDHDNDKPGQSTFAKLSRYFSWNDTRRTDNVQQTGGAFILSSILPGNIPLWFMVDFAIDTIYFKKNGLRCDDMRVIILGIYLSQRILRFVQKVFGLNTYNQSVDKKMQDESLKMSYLLASVVSDLKQMDSSVLELILVNWRQAPEMIKEALLRIAKEIENSLAETKNIDKKASALILNSMPGLTLGMIEIVVAMVSLFTQRRLNVFHTTLLILNSAVQAMKKNTKAELEKLRDKGFRYHLINPIMPASAPWLTQIQPALQGAVNLAKNSKKISKILTFVSVTAPIVGQTTIAVVLSYRLYRMLSEVSAERSILAFSAANNPVVADAFKEQEKFLDSMDKRARMAVAVVAALQTSRLSVLGVSFPFEALATLEVIMLYAFRNSKTAANFTKMGTIAILAALTSDWRWAMPLVIMATPKFDNDWANAFMRGPIMVAIAQKTLNVSNYRRLRNEQMIQEIIEGVNDNVQVIEQKLPQQRAIETIVPLIVTLSEQTTPDDAWTHLTELIVAAARINHQGSCELRSLRRLLMMLTNRKKAIRNKLQKLANDYSKTNTKAVSAVRKILTAEKFYENDDEVMTMRTVFFDGLIASMFVGSGEMLQRTSLKDSEPPQYKKVENLLSDYEKPKPILLRDTVIEVALSLRQRTQCTPKARMNWINYLTKNEESVTELTRNIYMFNCEFQLRKIQTILLNDAEFALTYVGMNDSVTGVFTSNLLNMKKLKQVMRLILDGDIELANKLGDTQEAFLCFGKKEVVAAKMNKARFKQIAEFNGDRTDDTRIRIIQAAEGPIRIEHKRSETAFNEALLLARHTIPIKIGLKYYQEWAATINEDYRYVIAIDIENFDGNQHIGFSIIPAILRILSGIDGRAVTGTAKHALQTQIRTLITKQGLVATVLGTMASGDINTSADNSIRTAIAATMRMNERDLKVLKFKCQGDNITIESKELAVAEKMAQSLSHVGLPTKIEGTCDRLNPNSALVQPEFLAVLGFRVKIKVQLFNGNIVTLLRYVPWRNPDRIMPKLSSVTRNMSNRRLAHYSKLKVMLWLYSWPLDKNLIALANNMRCNLQLLSQHAMSLSKHKTMHKTEEKDFRAEMTQQHLSTEESIKDQPESGKPELNVSKVNSGWDCWVANSLGLQNIVSRVLEIQYVNSQGKRVQMQEYKRVKGWDNFPALHIRQLYTAIKGKAAIVLDKNNAILDGRKIVPRKYCELCEEMIIVWPDMEFEYAIIESMNNDYDVQVKCVLNNEKSYSFLGMKMEYNILSCKQFKKLMGT